MPNYAQAAIQLRQNKERRAIKDRGSRKQKLQPGISIKKSPDIDVENTQVDTKSNFVT